MTVRRVKTYTGETGYVYQYYFVGARAALDGAPEAPATEYVFDVTSDRKTTYAVSVFLTQRATESWAEHHRRSLTDAEQFAAAKLRLFRAFDQVEKMMSDGRRLLLEVNELEEMLAGLGIE